MKKKLINYNEKKKNFVQKIEFWATAQVYCKKILYCNLVRSVL